MLSLAKRGVHSIFTYQSNRAEAEKVASLAREAGAKAVALQLDTGNVGAFDDFVAAVRKTLQSWGREQFDYLVNNAGNSQHINFEKMTEADFDAVVNVHFKGVYFLTQKLLPLMNDGGRIANLSSGLTRVAVPGSSAYAAAKGAVEILTRYLAKELASRGIAANTVAPSAIETDIAGGSVHDDKQVNDFITSVTALGRAGVADDIGPAVASLLTEDNRWINAQRIEIFGGMFL